MKQKFLTELVIAVAVLGAFAIMSAVITWLT